MQKLLSISVFLFLCVNLISCNKKEKVDLIIHDGIVYTVDSGFRVAEAFAVKDGKFVAVGAEAEIMDEYVSDKTIDAKGKAIYPGFFDAHCHFDSYGRMKTQCDLVGCRSFKEMVDRLVAYAKTNKASWIMGRGWDQNRWLGQEFPVKDTLDKLFPNTPVYLSRVDGHAALVNQKALDLAGIKADTKISGGNIILKNDKLTGIVVDNAADKVKSVIPKPTHEEMRLALLKAQEDCFKVGLTTVDIAGLDRDEIELIDSLQKKGELKMRVYAMASGTDENMDYYLKKGPYKTDRLHVCSFKFYADGALGSRGACLLKPYTDRPAETGFLLNTPAFYEKATQRIANSPFQMNTHCIGDSANRFILNTYAKALGKNNNRRWRIEHAQIVNKDDFNKFGLYHILPSVQPTHATSDMYWAKDRIGEERLKGGYAYKQLLLQNGVLPLGSDFPVESINPLLGFYAAVARQDSVGFPSGGFQPENALTREEALKGMTIWAAYSNFEEKEKGSIEPGKIADFVILDEDIMKAPIKEVRTVKVLTNSMGL